MVTTLTEEEQKKLDELRVKMQARLAWRLAYPHVHPELRDPQLRSILANELLVLRRRMRETNTKMNSDMIHGVRVGLETFARRVQDVETYGMERVYAENFKKDQEASQS